MKKARRHLPYSIWALAGIVLFGVGLAALMLLTDTLPEEASGRWVQDGRGVWIADGTPMERPDYVRQQEFLIGEARLALQVVENQQQDVASGPCLGAIFQDWVADIVHAPRTSVDDDPANQCEAYTTGEARHVVELTKDGEIVRVL